AAFVAIGSGAKTNQGGTAPQQNTSNVDDLLKRLPDLEKAAKEKPADFSAQKSLADTYYDIGFSYLESNKTTDMEPYFVKAVDAYQKTLAIKFDINVQTDMATAAFYGNKPDVADAAFKKAIEQQPDFLVARVNYGIFLRDAKQDKAGAKTQFEYVANQKKDADAAKKAADLLKTVQ
ncbi:MAG TPA: hypothetical protein VNU93_05185, partial [Verrucomicrobiae bacterium]|nr:hypothetical protein [Verrucomicrobiae bacterium]